MKDSTMEICMLRDSSVFEFKIRERSHHRAARERPTQWLP
jgi:hypothetical protein